MKTFFYIVIQQFLVYFQIWIRKIPDNCKMRISVGQLEKGQIFLRRRWKVYDFFSIGIELICQGLNEHSVFIKMWKKCGTLPYMWQLYLYMYLVLSTFMKFITWVVINMFCWIIVVSQRFIFFLRGNYWKWEIVKELPCNTGDIMTLFEAKCQY